MKHIGSVAKACLQIPIGPGFGSQVPHVICYILFPGYPMPFQLRGTSCVLIQMLARWPQARSSGPDVISTICSSQRATWNSRKSARPACYWAIKLLSKPPFSSP